jgi:hypothetical protein
MACAAQMYARNRFSKLESYGRFRKTLVRAVCLPTLPFPSRNASGFRRFAPGTVLAQGRAAILMKKYPFRKAFFN